MIIYCKPTLIHYNLTWDLQKRYWFTDTICWEQDVDYVENNIPEAIKDWFAAKNICDKEALANLAKFSRTQIKVGLQ